MSSEQNSKMAKLRKFADKATNRIECYEKRWMDFGERFQILDHIKTCSYVSLPKSDSELLPAKIPNLFKSIAIAITHSITSRQQFSHK